MNTIHTESRAEQSLTHHVEQERGENRSGHPNGSSEAESAKVDISTSPHITHGAFSPVGGFARLSSAELSRMSTLSNLPDLTRLSELGLLQNHLLSSSCPCSICCRLKAVPPK